MRVIEIFSSIDGEGITSGLPAVFVRLSGCNLRCSYCDTSYAYEGGQFLSAEQIRDTVLSYNIPRVTVTGGEPLIHEGIEHLLSLLCQSNLSVNVETNGSVDVKPVRFAVEDECGELANQLFFTIDYKCPSSGEDYKMCLANFENPNARDVIKFVVGNDYDLSVMSEICEKFNPQCSLFVSPVFGKIKPKTIVDYLLQTNLVNVRLQMQLHKIIWPVDMRGV